MKWKEAHKAFRRAFIEAALRRCNGKVYATAMFIGLDARNLKYHIKALGIDPAAIKKGPRTMQMFRAQDAYFAEFATVADYAQEAEVASHADTALVARVISK